MGWDEHEKINACHVLQAPAAAALHIFIGPFIPALYVYVPFPCAQE